MMKRKKLFLTAACSLALACAVLLSGCGAASSAPNALKDTGSLLLSVNPEIEIEYDKAGLVTALSGQNEDGEKIVQDYPDYIGKDCGVVLSDLICSIGEAGYFAQQIDGREKNIVLQLEPGSVLPSDDFLADMSASAQQAVQSLQLSSGVVTVDEDDRDPAYASAAAPSPYITVEKAREIALAQAGVPQEQAVFEEREFDHDDGRAVFELEFTAGGIEYEYDVDAVTGKVLRAEHRSAQSGATDYADTDYGPNNDGVTDYADTDYGPNNDGVTDYADTDYGPDNDGVTDYTDTDYGPNNDGVTDYGSGGDSGYDDAGDSGYDDAGDSGYDAGGDSGYGDSGYDD